MRRRIGLLAVAALLAVFAGMSVDAAPVWAQVADPEGSRIVWACWRTGDVSGLVDSNAYGWRSPGWGYRRGFAVEGGELTYSTRGVRRQVVENPVLSLPQGQEYAFYDSLRDFLDYTFFVHIPADTASVDRVGFDASDIAKNDVRRRLMLRLLVPGSNNATAACGSSVPLRSDYMVDDHLGCDYEDAIPDHGLSRDLADFLAQRWVMSRLGETNYGEAVITGVTASWEDLDSTDGGAAVDHAAIVSQQLAGQQDFDLTTQGYITGGSERALTTDEEIVQTVTVTTDTRCSGGQSCTSHTSSSSGFQTRDTTDVTVETVDQEVLRQNRTPDGVNPNRLGPDGSLVDVGREGPDAYSLDERQGRQEGFVDFDYSDTNSDALYVELVLNPLYREDFLWEAGSAFDGEVVLNSFGRNPWTYRGYGANLDIHTRHLKPMQGGSTQKPVFTDTGGIFTSGSSGYRVPFLETLNGSNGDLAHIRWPVNFADLHWYLYEVTPERGDQGWLRLLHPKAQERVAAGGYVLAGDFPEDYDGTCSYRDDIPGRDVVCGKTAGGSFSEEDFDRNHFFFPFDRDASVTGAATPLLSSALLRRAGVATPLDAEVSGRRRMLTQFGFTISDQSPLPAAALEEGSYVGMRYAVPGRQSGTGFAASDGVPAVAAARWPYQDNRVEYLRNWPAENLVPDRGHLLVVTYYESYRQDGQELQVKLDVGYFGRDKQVEYPKRMLRKVLCRIYIPPIGVTSAEQEGIWGWSWFTDKAGEVLDWGSDVMGRIVVVALRSTLDVAQSIVGGSARVACSGMTYLDQAVRLEVGGDSEPIRPTATHGALRLSEVEANRNTGLGRCRSISEREDLACDFDGSVVFRQNCGSLPEVQPYIRSVDFVTPEKPVPYTEYGLLSQEVLADAGVPIGLNGYSYGLDQGQTRFVERLDRVFRPSYEIGDGAVRLEPDNKGLSRVEIAWNFSHTGDNPVPIGEIDGIVVEVWPDPKVDPAATGEDPYRFFLPRAVEQSYTDTTSGTARTRTAYYPVDSFSFGALGYYDEDEAWAGSIPSTPLVQVAEPRRYVNGDYIDQPGSTLVVASGRAIDDSPNFVAFMENLPVAPGFRHRISVRAFEHDPIGGLVYGPSGTVLVVDGDRAACLDEESDENTVYHVPRDDDWHLARQLYDCDGSSTLGSARRPGAVDVARLGEYGLLSPLQMDICKDLFSTTPPGFTWDNPVVKQVWSLAWVLAGGVLFVLLVWQGLRMTYDWWIDPSPSTGFRELVPRFLLAFSLASVSLYICQLVLILAADATCFVAQHTGITMWGMWGTTMGGMFEGYMAWSEQLIGELDERDGTRIESVIRGILLALGMFLVMIVFIVVLLYFFVKVAIAMLLRLALLAVLCALSPMAFAMYASESTAHWTKTWVSMFLGVTFQQVVTLVVIFLGGQFMGNFLQEGDGTNFTLMIVSLVLSVLILGLADKVPDLVNPSGRGLFGSAGTALRMGAGAAVVGGFGLASLGGGLVGGAALGAARGATTGARNTYGGISGFVTGFRGGAQGTSSGEGGGGDDGSSGGGGGSAPSGGGPGASPVSGGGGPNVSPAAGGSSGGGWGAGLRGARAGFMGGSGQSSGEESPGGQGSGSQAAAGQSSGGGSSGRGGQPSVGRRLVESNPVTGVAAGAIGGALSGLRRGAVAGIQRGQSMNNRFENVARGHFLYRHRGVQDDAAARMERQQRLRQQQPAAAQDFSQGFASRLAEAMVEAQDKAAARQAAAQQQGSSP